MPLFTEKSLEKLYEDFSTVKMRTYKLVEAYAYRPYRTELATEHAKHGYSRRLTTLSRCIKRIFDTIPPESNVPPTEENFADANICAQAFIFNSYGAVDNLAWIFASEAGLLEDHVERRLRPRDVGLFNQNRTFQAALSDQMRGQLTEFTSWFENLTDYRHALGHRIPLFIPPYVVPEAHQKEYDELDKRKWNAHDAKEYQRLKEVQLQLVRFQPIMKHSLFDGRAPIAIHAQFLSDFGAIEVLGEKMLEELPKNN